LIIFTLWISLLKDLLVKCTIAVVITNAVPSSKFCLHIVENKYTYSYHQYFNLIIDEETLGIDYFSRMQTKYLITLKCNKNISWMKISKYFLNNVGNSDQVFL